MNAGPRGGSASSVLRRIGAGLLLAAMVAFGVTLAVDTPSRSGSAPVPWRIVAGGVIVVVVAVLLAASRHRWGSELDAWGDARPLRRVILGGLLNASFMTLWFVVLAYKPLHAVAEGFGVAAVLSVFDARRARTKVKFARLDAEFAASEKPPSPVGSGDQRFGSSAEPPAELR